METRTGPLRSGYMTTMTAASTRCWLRRTVAPSSSRKWQTVTAQIHCNWFATAPLEGRWLCAPSALRCAPPSWTTCALASSSTSWWQWTSLALMGILVMWDHCTTLTLQVATHRMRRPSWVWAGCWRRTTATRSSSVWALGEQDRAWECSTASPWASSMMAPAMACRELCRRTGKLWLSGLYLAPPCSRLSSDTPLPWPPAPPLTSSTWCCSYSQTARSWTCRPPLMRLWRPQDSPCRS
mmetsp:Transcript_20448/g.44662  ORF Transcript_20448/g.44662 Transcript_20448/m.44662 type:complete len:239 (+) Transcript_20448:800-1516(+)